MLHACARTGARHPALNHAAARVHAHIVYAYMVPSVLPASSDTLFRTRPPCACMYAFPVCAPYPAFARARACARALSHATGIRKYATTQRRLLKRGLTMSLSSMWPADFCTQPR